MSLEQQLEITVAPLTIPQPAKGTAGAPVGDDLHSAVARWLNAECVGDRRFTTSTCVLWREFRNWSGLECTQDEFSAGLEHGGFVVDRGMVEGLALSEDLLAAVEYERERLRSKMAVQLDLFALAGQDALPKVS